MKRRDLAWVGRGTVLMVLLIASTLCAQTYTMGVETVLEAVDPVIWKWYRPQELYNEYKWTWWEYSNYAKDIYQRYTDILLEGERWHDLYGNYITKGWQIYEWRQDQPLSFGSNIIKSGKFSGWFDKLVLGHTSKGEYNASVMIGEEIRTTLTPMTFSKPAFNGIQVDFMSDKYAFTAMASRSNSPISGGTVDIPESRATDFSNLFGFRGTIQVGDFLKLGGTYVSLGMGRTTANFGVASSFKGNLTTFQNRDVIQWIAIRLSDDSPEDGKGGAILFSERVFLDGKVADVKPLIQGGLRRGGLVIADGKETVTLTYTFPDPELRRMISFELVLSNDYRVEVTSNLQTNVYDQPVYLLVDRAPGNVDDGSNQSVVRFKYGLPTANEIYGLTVEVQDLAGFSLTAEFDVNNRYRRFPNINFENHELSKDRAMAFYTTLRWTGFPWFGYGEIFSIDDDYSTSMFLVGSGSKVDYENNQLNLYEFVDDNDDQDRYPDWVRANQLSDQNGIFPGLDEDNDLRSDFNENHNLRPDYDEPFLRYQVDPPELLFGMDMNNNTVVDRFEDDSQPDYPYRRDHRGFNAYLGVEVIPGAKFRVGQTHEWLWSDDRSSRRTYAVFTFERDYARFGTLKAFNDFRILRDNVPDDVLLWVQTPGTLGGPQSFEDPLIGQNAIANTAFLGFTYTRIRLLNVVNKIKYETYWQRGGDHFARRLRAGIQPEKLKDSRFLGIINKLDYRFQIREDFFLQPRWKSIYRYQTPYVQTGTKEEDLSEMLSLNLTYVIMKGFVFNAGVEYMRFFDLVDAPGSSGDFTGTVLAGQLSLVQDYMGYEITINIGAESERKEFETFIITTGTAFISAFAGIGD